MRNLLETPRIFPILAIALLLGTVIFLLLPEPPPREAVKWKRYQPLDTLKTNRPIFLEVSATWCGPCIKMKYTTFQDRELGELINRNFYPMRMEEEDDVLAAEKTIKKLGFEGYPSFFVLKNDGAVIERFRGYQSVYTLRGRLNRILEHLNNPLLFHVYPSDCDKVEKDRPWLIMFSQSGYGVLGRSLHNRLHLPTVAALINKNYYLFDVSRWPYVPYQRNIQYFSIRSMPTLLILHPASREVVARINELPTKEQLVAFLEENDTIPDR